MSLISDFEIKTVFLSLSHVLSYPDEELLSQTQSIEKLISVLKPEISGDYAEFHNWFVGQPLLELQKNYVEIFDQKHSSCLYLTFYLNGDTRQRGMALWRFAQKYKEFGFELDNGELPDFLPAVLGFGATIDLGSSLKLLQGHHRALLVLLESLKTQESQYVHLLKILMQVLPQLSASELKEAETLINAGPPTELVGLEGYGGPVSVSIGMRP